MRFLTVIVVSYAILFSHSHPLHAQELQDASSEPVRAERFVVLERDGVRQHLAGDYSAAEASFLTAADARRQVQGSTNSDVAYSLDLAAWAIYAQGRISDARQIFEQALALCPDDDPRQLALTYLNVRPSYDHPNPDIGFSLEGIGGILQRQGLREAHFEVALAAMNFSRTTAPIGHDDIYQHAVKLTEAVFDGRSALDARQSILAYPGFGQDVREYNPEMYLCYALLPLAQKLEEFKLNHSALIAYEEALNLSRAINVGCPNPFIAADYFYKIGRLPEAIELYNRGRSLMLSGLDDGSADFGISRSHIRANRTAAGADSLESALVSAGKASRNAGQNTIRLIEIRALQGALALAENEPSLAYARLASAGESALRRTRLRMTFSPQARREYAEFVFLHRDAISAAWLVNDPLLASPFARSALEGYLERPTSQTPQPSFDLVAMKSCMPAVR